MPLTTVSAAQAGEDFVIFHPGSARAEKFWEANRWGEVIDHCARETGMKCLLTGGRAPMEQAQALADVVEGLRTTSKSDLPARIARWLDALDETGRWALLKLITGEL